jgi:hypothetical protein
VGHGGESQCGYHRALSALPRLLHERRHCPGSHFVFCTFVPVKQYFVLLYQYFVLLAPLLHERRGAIAQVLSLLALLVQKYKILTQLERHAFRYCPDCPDV